MVNDPGSGSEDNPLLVLVSGILLMGLIALFISWGLRHAYAIARDRAEPPVAIGERFPRCDLSGAKSRSLPDQLLGSPTFRAGLPTISGLRVPMGTLRPPGRLGGRSPSPWSFDLKRLRLMSISLMSICLIRSQRERPQPYWSARIAEASLASSAMRVASSSRPAKRCWLRR